MSSDVRVAQHLTADEVAERWQVDRFSIYGMVKRGQLRALRIGRRLRFRMSDVEAFEEQNTTHKERER